VLLIQISFYFDDCNIVDWKSQKGSGQRAVRSMLQALGAPFAEEKQQGMSQEGDFLGLEHAMEKALSFGYVRFWVRQRLEDKIMDMIKTAESSRIFHGGTASKLYGCANFFELGVYGKVGRAGLIPIKDRIHDGGHDVHEALLKSFEFLKAVIYEKPYRLVQLGPRCAAFPGCIRCSVGYAKGWYRRIPGCVAAGQPGAASCVEGEYPFGDV